MAKVKAFHGTAAKFDSFDGGKARVSNDYFGGGHSYFTSNKNVAVGYASSAMIRMKSKTPYVIAVDLHFKKLFDARDNKTYTGDELKHMIKEFKLTQKDLDTLARGAGIMTVMSSPYQIIVGLERGTTKLTGKQFFNGLTRLRGSMENARKFLQSKGYDGLAHTGGQVTRDMMGTPNHVVFIVYDPNVIQTFKRFRVPESMLAKVKSNK